MQVSRIHSKATSCVITNSRCIAVMATALATRRTYNVNARSYGMCFAAKHGLIIVSDFTTKELHMYSALDGSLTRSVGSKGTGCKPFNFDCGGLSVSADGDSVLVADCHNHLVHEVRIADGSWVRAVGEGILTCPQHLACNADVIVVSEHATCHRVSVLSWADGGLRARLGGEGTRQGRLRCPSGLLLLPDGSGIVVADQMNDRLCLFRLSGELVAVTNCCYDLRRVADMVACPGRGTFMLTDRWSSKVVQVHLDCTTSTGIFTKYANLAIHGDALYDPCALAGVPNDTWLVLDASNQHVRLLTDHRARLAWIRACGMRIGLCSPCVV
jgi:hypothetical protein